MNINNYITEKLFALQDSIFREFNAKLIPSVPSEKVIGVRTPALRNLAKEIVMRDDLQQFLSSLPHRYFEENQLHAFIISSMKDYPMMLDELEKFLQYVDNWATCDQMNPKVFAKHLPELLVLIKKWIYSKDTYTVRFALNMLMTYFLDGEFKSEYLSLAASVKSEEYYVNMMLAWYFATALAKQYEAALPFIEENRLSKWVHNKTIQKAIESYRISSTQKEYLKRLKIK